MFSRRTCQSEVIGYCFQQRDRSGVFALHVHTEPASIIGVVVWQVGWVMSLKSEMMTMTAKRPKMMTMLCRGGRSSVVLCCVFLDRMTNELMKEFSGI